MRPTSRLDFFFYSIIIIIF